MDLCSQLETRWPELLLAAQAIHEANRVHKNIQARMRAFIGDILSHRVQGKPRTMLDAKEARDFLFYTSLNFERIQALLAKKSSSDPMLMSKIEAVLRKDFRLFRDVFRHYAITNNSSGMGITLEGLVKLYQDCKLRSRDLAPHHVESIFYDLMDGGGGDEKVLTPKSFVEVMLHFAAAKFGRTIDALPEQVEQLVEQHLKPFSCKDTENLFQKMAYNPKVREVLRRHVEELQIVFQIYAALDTSTTQAMQEVNTMNIKEFQLLLQHCELIDDVLTEEAVKKIFESIQQSASDLGIAGEEDLEEDDGLEQMGLDDDDELAFSEFLDGLVAVAAYKHPDPFAPFCDRVNIFILELFGSLRRYWSRKRVSSQVNAMLNALQKKLR